MINETEIKSLEKLISERQKENEQLKNEVMLLRERGRASQSTVSEITTLNTSDSSLDYDKIHFNDSLIYRELERRGIKLTVDNQIGVIQAQLGSHCEYLLNGTSRFVPFIFVHILENKLNTKEFLRKKGYPVSEARIFNWNEAEEALEFAKNTLGYPVVIKPTNGSGGRYVFCNIASDSEFKRAFYEIGQATVMPCIMVEKFQYGADDYRFFIIRDKTISVVRRTPPKIFGDGVSTVNQLIETENFKRMNPRNTCLCPIFINDSEGKRCLKNQAMTANSIPKLGQIVQCRFTANVTGGGDCENVVDQIHSTYFDIAKNILELFPGLPFLAIDLLIQDPTQPAAQDQYVVCECCCFKPGLSLHTHPGKGKSHDIITPF